MKGDFTLPFLFDEMENFIFSRFMCIIAGALMDAVMEYFHITEAQLEELTACPSTCKRP